MAAAGALPQNSCKRFLETILGNKLSGTAALRWLFHGIGRHSEAVIPPLSESNVNGGLRRVHDCSLGAWIRALPRVVRDVHWRCAKLDGD